YHTICAGKHEAGRRPSRTPLLRNLHLNTIRSHTHLVIRRGDLLVRRQLEGARHNAVCGRVWHVFLAWPRLHPQPTMMPADHAPSGDRLRAELARLEVECMAHLLDTEKVVGARQSRIGHDDAGEHIERGQEWHL